MTTRITKAKQVPRQCGCDKCQNPREITKRHERAWPYGITAMLTFRNMFQEGDRVKTLYANDATIAFDSR